MIRSCLYCFSLLMLVCCGEKSPQKRAGTIVPAAGKQVVTLLPLGDTDPSLISALKAGLENRLPVKTVLLDAQPLPALAWYRPRSRYIADSLLGYLARQHHGGGKILGITTQDISTRKEPHANWGVMGLGHCPGKACVISSFRAQRRALSREHLENRMIVLAMHELGHTWSLPHCTNVCIMRDAEGKMNLDNGNTYCTRCLDMLQKAGILPVF